MEANDYININRIAYDKLSNECKCRSEIRSIYEELPEKLVNNVLHFAPISTNLNILEIGPGSGEIISCFEKLGHRTIAVELSKNISNISKGIFLTGFI